MVEVFKRIVRGFYPELTMNPNLNSHNFYAYYVDAYIERDVSDLINVKDKFLFRQFLELLASLTGQELVYDNLSKIMGIDAKTVKSWIGVLLAGISSTCCHLITRPLSPSGSSSGANCISQTPV